MSAMSRQEYYYPILESLFENDGFEKAEFIIKTVIQKVKDRLTSKDWENVNSSAEPRCENSIRWARKDLIKLGLINPCVKKGFWEISEDGKWILQQIKEILPQKSLKEKALFIKILCKVIAYKKSAVNLI